MGESLYCIYEQNLHVFKFDVLKSGTDILREHVAEYKRNCRQFSATNYRSEQIIIIGGQRSIKASKTVLSLRPRDKKFSFYTKLPKLNKSRHSHAACELDGKLYVFGGLTKLGKFKESVERIDLAANETEWKIFAP